jgi:hypothetical protein
MIHLRGSRIGGIVQQLLVFPFPFQAGVPGQQPPYALGSKKMRSTAVGRRVFLGNVPFRTSSPPRTNQDLSRHAMQNDATTSALMHRSVWFCDLLIRCLASAHVLLCPLMAARALTPSPVLPLFYFEPVARFLPFSLSLFKRPSQ